MKFKITLVLAAIAIASIVVAQNPSEQPKRTCGSLPTKEWENWFNQKVTEFEEQRKAGKAPMVNYVIPVVVHVIHGNQSVGQYPNISVAQINSQITVLNNDFAGTGLNANTVPSPFAGLVANTNITFCLAALDPSGVALQQPGIHRVNYTTIPGAINPASHTNVSALMGNFDNYIKPATIWDPSRYFNIWISDAHSSTGILGYATFPAGSGLSGSPSGGSASTDGIWVGAKFFGNMGSVQSPYNKGRTATHETGHWLGLRHIDGDANCGNDFCSDTPVQQTLNFGCPGTFPKISCSNSPNGEMYMNFMDYCDDACLYMFTPAQSTRMQTALTNAPFRNQLTASSATLCNITAVAPTADFTIQNEICHDSVAIISNASSGTPGPTYSWTAVPDTGITFTPNRTATNPTISFTFPGNYTIGLVATNSAGSNAMTSLIQVTDCYNVTGLKRGTFESNISIFPNPSKGLLTINANTRTTGTLIVEVANCLGQVLMTSNVDKHSSGTTEIDLGNLEDGIYFVKIGNGTETTVKRIILNK
jgi:hypothetical protein